MPLRIVAYTNNRNSILADSLARCINERTNEMCRSVWGDETGGGILFDGFREWKRAPHAVRDELASADLIIRCAGQIAPQHRALTASKAIVTLTPGRPLADTPFLRIGIARSLRGESQSPDSPPGVVPFPLPWWDADYRPSPKGAVLGVYSVSQAAVATPGNGTGDSRTAEVLGGLHATFSKQIRALRDGQQGTSLSHIGRAAHILIDDCGPGGGGGYSLAALAWGCVVINGLGSSPSIRATMRSLTESNVDPPFLCASPETLEPLLACLIRAGPAALVAQGQRNRRWLEHEWDFKRQWSLFWTPIIHKALGSKSEPAGPQPWGEVQSSVRRPKSVSVVIVTRDEGVYLRRTVQSLHESLSSRDEIIVVDDQSTDGSADNLSATYEGVRVLRPDSRLGVAGGRNYGAQQAGGDIIVFSDAHVEVPKDWVAPLVDALCADGAGAAGAGLQTLETRAGKGVCGGRWRPGRDDYLQWQWLSCRDSEPYPVPLLSGGFLALRHEVLDAVGGFDTGMWLYGVEDTELSVRLWTLGYQCLAVPRVLVAHRFSRPGRMAQCDYKSGLGAHIHNKLRLAVLHFGPERITRVVKCFAPCEKFPVAFARLAAGDAWIRRREIQATRKYDDDWYFRRFGSSL